MKFSLHNTFQSPTSDWPGLYKNIMEQTLLAEKNGFDSILVAEHHFVRDGCMPSSRVVCGALAAITKKVRIGTGVTLLPLHDPIRVAEDAAVVDNISNGRFVLGLGIGNRVVEYEISGIPFEERRSRFEESLVLIRRLLTEEHVSHDGKHYHLKDVTVSPRTVQKPSNPIWIGAEKSKRAVRRAAAFGDAWVTAPITPIKILKEYFQVYKDTLRDLGKDFYSRERPLRKDGYIAKDNDTAWEESKEGLLRQYRDNYFRWGALWDDNGNPINEQNANFEDYIDSLRKRFIIGGPDTFIGEVEKYARDLEATNIVLRIQSPGLQHEKVSKAISLIGEKVIPYFQHQDA